MGKQAGSVKRKVLEAAEYLHHHPWRDTPSATGPDLPDRAIDINVHFSRGGLALVSTAARHPRERGRPKSMP